MVTSEYYCKQEMLGLTKRILTEELRKKLVELEDSTNLQLSMSIMYFKPLSLKNVEHALCEYDKYYRAVM